MALRFTILGCGTSAGVPRIGNDWGSCDPLNPKNRRTRVSLLVQSDTTTILVDTSPDMREQLLAAGIYEIDAVLWTHDHADHCHGIDDLRQVYHHRTYQARYHEPIDGYARAQTMKLLKKRFAYAFEGREGYSQIIEGHELPNHILIGDIAIRCVDMPHGAIWSTGFRFEHGGRSMGYATDFHQPTEAMLELFAHVDVWVVDALREKPHPTHPHLAMTLDAIHTIAPERAYLTHMDNSLDYERLSSILPPAVKPAYDGLNELV